MNPAFALRLSLAALVASLLALCIALYSLSEQAKTRADMERMVQMLSALHRPETPSTGAPRPTLDDSEM